MSEQLPARRLGLARANALGPGGRLNLTHLRISPRWARLFRLKIGSFGFFTFFIFFENGSPKEVSASGCVSGGTARLHGTTYNDD